MYNEEKIVNSVALIQDTCLTDLNKVEKTLTLVNLLLTTSKEFLPESLLKDSDNLLSNGRRVNYELNTKQDNTGLLLAFYTHHLLATLDKFLEESNE